MKKRVLAGMLAAMTLLAGCQADVKQDIGEVTTTMEDIEKADASEQPEANSTAIGSKVTVADLKEKYDESDDDTAASEEVMPLYNVAEDEVFDFTFQVDPLDISIPESDMVTVHTDSKCEPESELPVYADVTENGKGFTLSISPISAVLETIYNEQDEEENDHAVWGNAPMYYIAIWYDMESETLEKLDEPIIIPFTVKHAVEAPQVSGHVDSKG